MFSLFRNRAKRGSMTIPNLAFLLLKTIFDCTSRILLFATFMFVVNDGQFSTMMTVTAYYTTVAVIIAYNIVINDNETYCSARTWIGEHQIIIFFRAKMFLLLLLEILLNSFSSVLSYNQFDLEPIFTEKKALQKRVRHESTMVKQGIYFFLMTILYLG